MNQLKLDIDRAANKDNAAGLPNGFKMTEIGPLPEEWEVIQLGKVASVDWGNTSLTKAIYKAYGYPAFSAAGQDGFGDFFEHTGEAVIVSAIGARCGRCFFASGKWTAIKNTIIVKGIPSKASNLFLFYYLDDEQKWPRSGSGQPFIGIGKAKLVPIPLPPLPEQRAIARVLRTVQEAIVATERVIAAARALKRSMMEYLFTYGPVPVDQTDQVEIQEAEFGRVPEAWRILPLEECGTVQTGIAKGRKGVAGETISVPYLRVANVQDGFLDLTEIKSIEIRPGEEKRYGLRFGDVLLTEGGDFDKLGRGAIWRDEIPNCVHQNHIFAVRADGVVLSPEYLGGLVQTRYSKGYFLNVAHRTTHLACINSTKLKALPTPLPSMAVQGEIVARLESIDDFLKMQIDRRDVLGSILQTLLHNLMTGKIRVTPMEADREGTDSVRAIGTGG